MKQTDWLELLKNTAQTQPHWELSITPTQGYPKLVSHIDSGGLWRWWWRVPAAEGGLIVSSGGYWSAAMAIEIFVHRVSEGL
ncbi:hypothetical protein E2C01_075376 [Portunus trituberculatus]|uniref:Uncharacterized protein n=1 Tax=Portunus trituberculatus TaxID=210409 RepID=A0A5B7IET8_PORTR|nr:hypothetical protein [Portunus trituberculatus]